MLSSRSPVSPVPPVSPVSPVPPVSPSQQPAKEKHPSFGSMAKVFNETETSSESTATREGQDNATVQQYMRNKNLVLDFLRNELNPRLLRYHWNRLNLLKKCYFYLKIEPRHLCVRDPNNMMICADILQIANPCQLQKIKKIGKNQTEIQLALLTGLLEQLDRGRKELSHYVETCDMATFLSQWDLTIKKVLKLSVLFSKLIALEEPRKLHVKHSLVSQVILGGAVHPHISLSLYTKKPPIFDRRESFASQNWAQLKWINENQESHLERWQLEIKLMTDDSQTEPGYSRIQEVISNPCVIHHLQPGRSYEFRVKRSDTHTLVYSQWHDRLVLQTKTVPVEDTNSSTNGSTNSSTNGSTNGNTNGSTNGNTNSSTTSSTNGSFGFTRRLTRTSSSL
ncbi:fibronectin type III domain-containing protein 11 isoform X1 [Manacus candei]|uniref:fibronectin type III domain-containing protein 11 isoform X1 n=2 Tax=Manacus candei TaxID=415023 RepID=UPI002225E0D3|nr:fibronectin type III domain-containing protein 11 isoform X1 [Manacus candei]